MNIAILTAMSQYWGEQNTLFDCKKPRNLCKRTSMTDMSLLSIPGTLTAFDNLEWCHHAGIMLSLRVMKKKSVDNR